MACRLIVLGLIAGLLAPVAASAETVVVLYHLRPPYFMEKEGRLAGLSADRAAAAFKLAGIKTRWLKAGARKHLPAIKADKLMLCSPGWFKNKKRMKYARFSRPIYQDHATVILTRRKGLPLSHLSVESLTLDKRLLLLTKEGYSYGHWLDRQMLFARPHLRSISTVLENHGMAKMIAANRADYMFTPMEEGRNLLARADLRDKGLVLAPLSDMPEGETRHIVCTRHVTPALMTRLDKAILALQKKGSYPLKERL